MPKSKYYIDTFPSSSVKGPLATLSQHVLKTINRIFEILHMHADERHEQSPTRILFNMMQNNESIFGQGVSDTISTAGTSVEEKTSQEPTSPLKGASISSCLVQKLPFVDRTNEASVPKTLETKSTIADSQKPAEQFEKSEMLSSAVEGGKMSIATGKDAEMKTNPLEENEESMEFKEDIKDLLQKNSVEITSVSVIGHLEFTGVEIDFESDCMSDGSMLDKPEQESSPSKTMASPGKSEIKTKSPTGSPSMVYLSISSESHPAFDSSNPSNVLDFLAQRLMSIFKSRKTCMEQIDKYFKEFLRDVNDFQRTVDNINFIVETFPVSKEPYLSCDFLTLRQDLIDNASKLSEKAESLEKGVKEDSDVLEDCLMEMENFENPIVPPLSPKGASKQTIADLQKSELRLKEIITKLTDKLILKDDRRMILLKSLSDFKWLVNNFVKFLIITGILKPTLSDSSQIVTDK